nr:MAG TPA: hypothetical protein [Caudoviricetes sp.]
MRESKFCHFLVGSRRPQLIVAFRSSCRPWLRTHCTSTHI